MYSAPMIRKTLSVLRLMANEQRQLGNTTIATHLGLNKSTAFAILKVLSEDGYVFKDPVAKTYTLGSEALLLSKMILRIADLPERSRPFLESLAEKVNETLLLCRRQKDWVEIIDVVPGGKQVHVSAAVGTLLPLQKAGAVGKLFLSLMQDDQVDGQSQPRPHRRRDGKQDVSPTLKELRLIRRRGYAMDSDEFLYGVKTVAVPIQRDGWLEGAIWLTAFAKGMDDTRLARLVRGMLGAAQLITQALPASPRSNQDRQVSYSKAELGR